MDRPRKGKQARNVDLKSVSSSSSSSSSAMVNLPSHILMEIISRLPIKTVMAIRCVCKSLLSVVSEAYFKELHSTRAPTELLLRDPNQEDSSLSTTLYTTEPVFSDDSCIPIDMKFSAVFDIQRFSVRPNNTLNVRATRTKLTLVNSCYGLVCYCRTDNTNRFAIICNPITGEFVTIPPPLIRDWGVDYGLGFSHGRFKLLRLLTHYNLQTCLLRRVCEIYTFGESGSWRKVANSPDEYRGRNPIFYEGVLIWYTSVDIVTFDFDTEQFGKLVTPWNKDRPNSIWPVHMTVLRGCLYATSRDKYCVDIWVMEQYSQGSWVKAFSIKTHDKSRCINQGGYELIKHLGNGEMLMFSDSCALVCYNPDTKRERSIGRFCRDYEAVSIRPSLVSLKVMLGDDVKVQSVESWSAHKDRVEVATIPPWWVSSKMAWHHVCKVNDTSCSVSFTTQLTELEKGVKAPLQTEERLVVEFHERTRKFEEELQAQARLNEELMRELEARRTGALDERLAKHISSSCRRKCLKCSGR